MKLARGISSAGRALAWHARGQRFDPVILQINLGEGITASLLEQFITDGDSPALNDLRTKTAAVNQAGSHSRFSE